MNTLTPLSAPTLPLSVGATTPSAPAGALAYSSTLSSLLQFSGSSWQALASASGVTAVTATGNLSATTGTTPQISMLASPSFTNVTASGQFNGSGAGLTNATVPNAALVSTPVDLVSAQTIAGIKTFSAPPVFSGASITAGTIAPAALSTAPVLVSGAQTVAGVKTFSSAPVMSGASITNATIPNAALVTAPVTNVTGDGVNLSSNGGTTPAISLTASPTFNSVVSPSTSNLILNSGLSGGFTAVNFGGGATGGLRVYNGSTSTYGPILCSTISVLNTFSASGQLFLSAGSGTAAFNFANGTTGGLTIYNGGTGGGPFTCGTLTQTSDASLKENVVDIMYGLATIEKLQPRGFAWIEDGKPDIGFISQEVQSIIPESISTDGMSGLLGISYAHITTVLVAAVKELSAQFTAYVTAHP